MVPRKSQIPQFPQIGNFSNVILKTSTDQDQGCQVFICFKHGIKTIIGYVTIKDFNVDNIWAVLNGSINVKIHVF